MDPKTKLLKNFTIFIAVLLVISTAVLTTYGVFAAIIKNSITENMQPIVDEFTNEHKAEDVDIKIFIDYDAYNMPWDPDYHVFMTAHYTDLRIFTEADVLKILNNDTELGTCIDEYEGMDVRSTRTVEDSIVNKSYPVVTAMTDGDLYYTIAKDNIFDKNELSYKNPVAESPQTTSDFITGLFAVLTTVFLILFAFLIYKLIKISPHSEQNMKTAKKVLMIIGIVIIVGIIGVCIFNAVSNSKKQTDRYNEALALHESGDFDAAYKIFKEMGDYKDSEEYMLSIDYFRVNDYLKEGKPAKAYALLLDIEGYKDTAEMRTQLEADKPYLKYMLSEPGDIITLGEYEQDNNTENGKEPIEWIVLHSKDGKVYLLSKYVLDAQQFNTENSHECTLDNWLKTTFAETAFGSIHDDIFTRIGLLQRIDVDNYSMTKEQIIGEYTAYALAQDPEDGYAAGLMWWMISDDLHESTGHVSAPVVWETGEYTQRATTVTNRCGVRPVVWLFADENEIPAEPKYDGAAAKPWKPSSSSSSGSSYGSSGKCAVCNGSGYVKYYYGSSDLEAYLSGHDPYTVGKCTSCGGTGR
ncbi:MAG: hypothetical protein J6Q94_08870 [Clostridia bacterium]|nr:hypothetical protein [Clostridia bacterium]